MDRLLTEWRKVPLPLWALEVVLLASLVVIDVTVTSSFVLLVFGWVVVLGWAYLLLTGIRWLWFVSVALFILTIPGIVDGSVDWVQSVLTIIGLGLLLLPTTRGYFLDRP
jgi:hypothetical protein